MGGPRPGPRLLSHSISCLLLTTHSFSFLLSLFLGIGVTSLSDCVQYAVRRDDTVPGFR